VLCGPNGRAVGILNREASEGNHKFYHCQHVGDGVASTGNANQPPMEFHRALSVQVKVICVVRGEPEQLPSLCVVKDGIHQLLEGLTEKAVMPLTSVMSKPDTTVGIVQIEYL